MPVGVPLGSWTVTAQSTSNENTPSIARPINIERITKAAINTMPEGEINPLESYQCRPYQPGSKVLIRGANYAPNQKLPLAFYLFPPSEGKLRLTNAQFVETNGQGDFSTQISIEAADVGNHLVVVAVDPSLGEYNRENGKCYKVP
jgi:hypothetical protein